MQEPLSCRILVIDDNEAIHDDFRKILLRDMAVQSSSALSTFFGEEDQIIPTEVVQPSYELESALQGDEGLAKLDEAIREDRPFDLAFVDMRMPPGWNGVETIRQLWKSDPSLEVVICSAYSDYSWSEIVDELGLSDRLLILKKPFDNIELLQAAASLSSKRRLERENLAYRSELESRVLEQTGSLREAMVRLTESKDFLQSSIDSLDSQVAILDVSGALLFQNTAWTTGRSRLVTEACDEGSNYLQICDELGRGGDTDAELLSGAIRNVIAGEHENFLHEYKVERRDCTRWFTVRVTRFRDELPSRVVVMHQEITDYKRLQNRLGQARKLESIGQLAAGIAHEINTPMQYIGDNLEYLAGRNGKLLDFVQLAQQLAVAATEQGFEPELSRELQETARKCKIAKMQTQIPEAIRDSQDGVRHVSRIVRAMKELSHLGSESRTSVDLNRVLETARTVSTNEWKYVADVEIKHDPSLQPIEGLHGELNQVFLNLIVNAAHAISHRTDAGRKGKGKITLRTQQFADFVRVEVEDTGGGIPENIRDRVFDPFFTTKEVGKGTGQGLSLAHSVITGKHGGSIDFRVEAGVGTTFVIEFPLEAPEPEAGVENNPAGSRAEPTGVR